MMEKTVGAVRRLLQYQFIRFLLVGGMNTGFSYSVYAAFLYVGLSYSIANFLALVIGMCFSFRTQSALVFKTKNTRRIYRFVICWFIIYLLNIWLIGVLIKMDMTAYVAGALAILPMTIVSYFVQRLFVFDKNLVVKVVD